MSAPTAQFDTYDEKVAQGFVRASENPQGLPGYLGLRITDVGPGWMHAEAEVKDELLTPFGNMHGGVLAASCDHLLGCVCYPLIRKGQWAATTEFKLNYLAPVSRGVIRVEANVVSLTRSTAVVRLDVWNEGRLACAAQGLVLIRDPKGAAS